MHAVRGALHLHQAPPPLQGLWQGKWPTLHYYGHLKKKKECRLRNMIGQLFSQKGDTPLAKLCKNFVHDSLWWENRGSFCAQGKVRIVRVFVHHSSQKNFCRLLRDFSSLSALESLFRMCASGSFHFMRLTFVFLILIVALIASLSLIEFWRTRAELIFMSTRFQKRIMCKFIHSATNCKSNSDPSHNQSCFLTGFLQCVLQPSLQIAVHGQRGESLFQVLPGPDQR